MSGYQGVNKIIPGNLDWSLDTLNGIILHVVLSFEVSSIYRGPL